MIDRGLEGKQFPPFTVTFPESLSRKLAELFTAAGANVEPPRCPPLNWPAILTLHGTACLLGVWERLGVDPLDVRLVKEQFFHTRAPAPGEQLTGGLVLEGISEHVEPQRGVEEQVDLSLTFRDSSGAELARYECSFRVPVAPAVKPANR